MSLIARAIRFTRHEPWWLLLAGPAFVAMQAYRYPSSASIAMLLAASIGCFLLPYPLRRYGVLNYSAFRTPLKTFLAVAVGCFIVVRLVGYHQAVQLSLVGYVCLAAGLVFWPASDPMFEMAQWLAFPTEFGRLPDEIHSADRQIIDWPDYEDGVVAHLLRFRYDDEWHYGITGPITFALGDQQFQGKSSSDIFDAYRAWYVDEGIGEMLERDTES